MTDTGGNTLYAISLKRFEAQNPFIALNHLSTKATDARDIGIFGLYGTGTDYNYSGWYRDATTKRWTVFSSTQIPDYNGGAGTSSLAGFTKGSIDVDSIYCGALFSASTASFTGIVTISDQIQGHDGSATVPTYSFSSESTSGLYRITAGNVGLTAGGTLICDLTSARLKLPNCGIYVPNTGTLSGTAPAYAFTSAPTSGHRLSSGALVFSIAGTDVFTLASGAATHATPLGTTAAGTVSAPDLYFNDGVGTSGFYLTNGGGSSAAVNVAAYGVQAAVFTSSGLSTPQVSTSTLTGSGAITVGQSLSMGSNSLTTSGTVTTGTLTSAGASVSVTKPLNMNSNNISAAGIVSLSTLTGASTIAVSQNMDMGIFTLNASDIRGSGNVVSFNNGAGYIAANSIKQAAVTKSGAYAITSGDFNVEFTASTTCTLPLASTVVGQTFMIHLKGAGSLVIACTSPDTFFALVGPSSLTISRANSVIRVTPSADGSYWLC